MQDYETASYFYNRCLDISVEHKYLEGEARAYQGLGKAEENVLNKDQAMRHLETSLEKADADPNLIKLVKEISANLVRVYMQIATEHQEATNFGEALSYFEKCLDVAKKAQNEDIEAECYQRIGLIYHELGQFDEAIEHTNKFLNLSEASRQKLNTDDPNNANKRRIDEQRIIAHKQLAETYVTNPAFISHAIVNLRKVIDVAKENDSKQ